ncbi:MAG TPA: hypothetical protein VFE78_32430 [Gemmataceae bacterium]|jgi:hypothetical protein|nr:hypothetical protein [Gemmataceae bacterium]
MNDTGENPFEALRLPPTASEEEIVRQAGRLRQRATGEAALNAIRQAVQALTGRAEDRALLGLLAHPRPCYQWPALDKFAAAFRRAPAVEAGAAACPPFDAEELTSLLLAAVAEELELPPAAFEVPAAAEDAAEIQRQSAEAVWQSLLCDPRA